MISQPAGPAASRIGPAIRSRFIAVYPFARIDGEPRMLMLHRARGVFQGHWYMVTGTIEPGERAWRAAERELAEETGLIARALYSADFTDSFYNPADECIELVPAFLAVVDDDPPITLNHEADAFQWCDRAGVLALMPFAGHRRALADLWPTALDTPPAPWLRLLPKPAAGL
ncbi:NUDIX pyrophosphatase [Rhodospirillum rubrum]|uniref:NUDIX hydrolase n=1 Tax=Rhodospirillum rubrum TaxID=1085 RepID=UPI0019055591|nr:NUDIX pyrophosphatase [Rhodospirillum rubrum]MBK1663387.1 NUDIX pyrophosphatase [Rhodospirillum rubrum]MBK1675559.1 NUDIX pyrophosphatase [Rhodospirillum rubrum]